MSDNIHVTELLPAYALECLDEEDATVVIRHLASCAMCRAELRDYQRVAARLGMAAPSAAPGAGLKHRLMARVHRDNRQSIKQPPSIRWIDLPSLFRRAGPALAVASLALMVILIAGNVVVWKQATSRTALVPAGDMRTVHLVGTAVASDARGLVIISEDGRFGTLVVEHLPSLENTQQYQLWLIENGQRSSGAVFSVNAAGYGLVEIEAKVPLSNYSAFGITIEPYGGSPGPTGAKVLGGALSS